MQSPILFLIFNRPQQTAASFSAIRRARPPRLYVAADGPRAEKPRETKLCEETRSIVERVDWPCEVKTLFREKNVGGPRGIPEAINWFFQSEPEGIILEDDVIGSESFFRFCDELLEKYRDDPQVMQITGNNFQLGLRHGDASYFFSKITHSWGWATWARAWKLFMPVISQPQIEDFLVNTILPLTTPEAMGSVPSMLLRCVDNAVGHWDARWWCSVNIAGGLVATPNVPLTRNIGYGATATHTHVKSIPQSIPLESLGKIIHPTEISWARYADEVDYGVVFSGWVNSPAGLIAELRRRIARGDPEESVQRLARLGRKFFPDAV